MELFRKIKSGDIKLVKLFRKCKMCLNKIKTKYQEKGINQKKSASQNIKFPYESREAADELFNDYYLIASEAKYKIIPTKEIAST